MLPPSRPVAEFVAAGYSQTGQLCWLRALCSGLCSLISLEGAGLARRTRHRSMELCLTFRSSASLSRPHPWPSFLGTVAAFVILIHQYLWPWSFDYSWLYLLFVSTQRRSCAWLHFSTMQSVSMCESRTAVCSALARSTFQNKFSSQCDVLKAFVSLVWVFYLFLFIVSSMTVWSCSFLVYCLLLLSCFWICCPSYLYLLFPHPPIFSLPNSLYP